MVHEYKITGMTCTNCEAKVKSALLMVDHITGVEVSKQNNSATITMDKHVSSQDLQKALESKYQISAVEHHESLEQAKSWFVTYKPIILIFAYITLITLCIQWSQGQFNVMQWMSHFMAAFFLVFSFFKMLDLKGFANSYAMYDIVARKIPTWGYAYVFIELLLGIFYLINFNPLITNLLTLIVMLISIIGVLQTIFNKKKIQCACLGAVFNLPMSTITILEDGLMIGMSALMFFLL